MAKKTLKIGLRILKWAKYSAYQDEPNVNPRVFVRERQKSMAKSCDYGSKGQEGGKTAALLV